MKNWKRVLAGLLCGATAFCSMPSSAFALEAGEKAADGTYKATVTVTPDEDEAFDAYDLEVTVEVADGAIASVTASGAADDNTTYFNYAMNGRTKSSKTYASIPSQIVGTDATAEAVDALTIDAVSGATCCSNAIYEGVKAAIAAAPAAEAEEAVEKAMTSVSIGGVTYYYVNTKDDAANTVYTYSVTTGRGASATTTAYSLAKSDLTQVTGTDYYYAVQNGATALTGTLYGTVTGSGTATTYKAVYEALGVTADDSYDAVSSATTFTSFHAKDISSTVVYGTDADGNKAITGLLLEKTAKTVSAVSYVEASVLKAAGEELTADQTDALDITLKQNPMTAPSDTKVAPVAATAAWTTSNYGVGEFVINPDDTVEGYTWSEYWDNTYAVTISDGTTTVGAVHWIDVYGEMSTSGFHYNKLEIALNNGTSAGANAAEVSRYAAFFDTTTGNVKPGTYTITVYSDGYEPMTAEVTIPEEALSSTTIGGLTYYYADTTDDADNTVYTATVRSRMGSTTYNYTKADMTQVSDSNYYYVLTSGTALEGTLYAVEGGTTSTYQEVYEALGVTADDSYDVISSATKFTSGHAKDIASVVTYGTDADGNKAITGVTTGRTYTTVDAAAYVEACIYKAAGAELTEDQAALAAKTLKQNPTVAPSDTKVAPVAATATWTDTSNYGVGEFVINPDDTVEGYTWSEYWDNTYAVTISDGTTTVGAVHWIDVYGEMSTSGFHYNKLEIALNNGTSAGSNAAEVNRYAAFFDENGAINPGTYTITVYSDGYEPMTATVNVHMEELSSTSIGGLTYYFADTTGDADGTVYTATVRSRMGSTVYKYTKADMTQVGDSNYYYVLTSGTALEGTLYAVEGGTTSTYQEVYEALGVTADDSYDVISSATKFTSGHAKDIASVVSYGTDADGNKAITGVTTGRTYTAVDAAAYVEACIYKAAGTELTEEQAALAAKSLKQNPTVAPSDTKVAPAAATAAWTTSNYGVGEFVINPDDTVEGYTWSEYWDNTYAVTISDGTTTVGAVHWIDVYGEMSTSGFHYNKLEIALNNGTSEGSNAAEVSRYAAFFDTTTGNVKPGTYTITVYSDGYEPMTAEVTIPEEALSSTTIGGQTYYYADTTDDADNTVYTATVRSRMGSATYNYTKADMTQVGDSNYYYVLTSGTALEGTLYAVEGGTTSTYQEVYEALGVTADDSYDVISSATKFTSGHAKDIASVVSYGTDADGNKAITGVTTGRTYTTIDAAAYVEACIYKAAGAELTEDQAALAAKSLKQNPTVALSETKVVPVAATAAWTTSNYGVGEFVINPDDTVEGYTWSEYWDNTYAVTISDGTTTVGAVHWIDVYGEMSTSGFHYNKLEIALNNGTSEGSNAAEVNRYAAFFDANNNLKAGTYTITVYSDGYEPMTATVDVTADLSAAKVTAAASCTYTGKALTPAVTVNLGGVVLKKDVDYTVSYENNVNPGTAAYTITGTGLYTGSVSGTFTVKALSAPVLKTVANTASGVKVTWSGTLPSGCTYCVCRKTGSGSYAKLAYTTASYYVDKTAVSGTTYTYTVRCITSNGKTFTSSYNAAGISLLCLKQPVPVLSNTAKGVTVKWAKVTGAAGYYVYRKTAAGSFKKIATVNSSTLSYVDTAAVSGTTYYYTVTAYKGSTRSSYATDKKVLYLKTPTVTAAKVSTGIQVSWTKTTGAKGYYVYRRTATGSWARVYTATSQSTVKWIDKTAKSGTTYYYCVKAVNGSTTSAYTSSKAVKR